MRIWPIDPKYPTSKPGYIGLDDKWYDGTKRMSSRVIENSRGLEIRHLINEGNDEFVEIEYCWKWDLMGQEYPYPISVACEHDVIGILLRKEDEK